MKMNESPQEHSSKTVSSLNIHEGATFEDLVKKGVPLVDKTMFIAEIMKNTQAVVAITRPRKFGKTINLTMLDFFLNQTKDSLPYFKDLKIGKETDYCKSINSHLIIYLDLSKLNDFCYESNVKKLKSLMADLFNKHDYLLESEHIKGREFLKLTFKRLQKMEADMAEIRVGVNTLSEMLFLHHGKEPIILIDAYDTMLLNGYQHGFYKGTVGLISGLLHSSLKRNKHFHKAVIVGTFRVSYSSFFTGGNVAGYTVFDDGFSEYFGFTEKEVASLIPKYFKEKPNLENEMKEMYLGYIMGTRRLYNPWSVVKCLINGGKVENWWVKSSPPELTKAFFCGVLPCLGAEALINGVRIVKKVNMKFDDVKENNDAFWNYMTQLGYLTVHHREGYELAALEIPNKEIRLAFTKMLDDVRKKYNLPVYSKVVEAFRSRNIDEIQNYLKTYMQVSNLFESSGLYIEENLKDFMTEFLKGLEVILGPSDYLRTEEGFLIIMGPIVGTKENFFYVLIQTVAAVDKLVEPGEATKKSIVENVEKHLKERKQNYGKLDGVLLEYFAKNQLKIFKL